MKKFVVLCSLAILAGCAASGGGKAGLATLEASANMRAERPVPKNFVQVQRAVFQHQAACKTNVKFEVDELHPSYARVTKDIDPVPGKGSASLDHGMGMVLGLQLLQGMPARGRLYSYYTPNATQIQDMYDIILHPELCPGDPRPVAEPAKKE